MSQTKKSPGYPKSVSTAENLQKLKDPIIRDPRLKLSYLADEMGVPKPIICSMLTEDLGMKMVSARWVPKLLSASQKQDRVDFCNANFNLLNEDLNLLNILLVAYGTWVYYYDPVTK